MKLGYIALLAAFAATPGLAAEHDHGAAHATAVVEGRGQVNAVDAAAGTINVTHEPIAAIGWPAMTMDFAVEPKRLAAKVKVGQTVTFRLKKIDETDYVISAIEPAK